MDSKTYILPPAGLPAGQCSIGCPVEVLEILTQALMLPQEVPPYPSHPLPASEIQISMGIIFIYHNIE